MKIDIDIHISEKLFLKIKNQLFKQKRSKVSLWLNLISKFLSILVVVPLIILELTRSSDDKSFRSELIFIIFALIILFGSPYYLNYIFKKVYKNSNRKNFSANYLIDEKFINIKNEISEGKISWEGINEVREFEDWFLLLPNKANFYYIPKLSLTDEQILWFKNKVVK